MIKREKNKDDDDGGERRKEHQESSLALHMYSRYLFIYS